MSERKQIHQEFLAGERALFASNDLDIYDTIFDDGESPLKESHGISPVSYTHLDVYKRQTVLSPTKIHSIT